WHGLSGERDRRSREQGSQHRCGQKGVGAIGCGHEHREAGYQARALTSILRYQISANSISMAIFPRVKGMNLLGFCGSGCCSMETTFTHLPLTMCADRSPCQMTSTTFQSSRFSKFPSLILRSLVGSGGGAPGLGPGPG